VTLDQLKKLRQSLGLTQAELSRLAGVSVPLIQLLERGEGNPSLETLKLIGKVIGFDVQLNEKPANWPLLITAGLPLAGPHQTDATLTIWDVVREFSLAHAQAQNERERDALKAMLLAIKMHYPSCYRRFFAHQGIAIELGDVDGRVLKLSRMARARLSEWL
jgi:transcriptional regulator with XRE-family HTH domain